MPVETPGLAPSGAVSDTLEVLRPPVDMPPAFARLQCGACFAFYDLEGPRGDCPECGSDRLVGVDD